MINLLLWPVIGGLAGWIGGPYIIGGKDREMTRTNTVIGIIGGIAGGLLTSIISGAGITGFSPLSLVFALIGGVILLIALPRQYSLDILKKKKPSRTSGHSDCYILKTASELKEQRRRGN